MEAGLGRIIDRKYELIASIGKGGMAHVWLARDRRLEKLWAMKEIMPGVAGSQGAANRQAIIDEANFMKRLDHPAIPRVVDIIDTGGSIFVVMDYVEGRALSRVLRERGRPFEQEQVIDWGIQLCDVLGYLHGIRPPDGYPVVYRDMKPANVMLRDDGSVKLVDFGIAMELLPSGPSDARVIGTAGYGAPEQVDPELHEAVPVDTRADIYALGTTLYSLVTGHVPRVRRDGHGRTTTDFEMRPFRAWDPQLSDGLEQVIARATERDPADRYQTVEALRYDLEHYEELTEEHRDRQRAKVRRFWWRVRAAAALGALGIACLTGAAQMRRSSFDALMHEASVSSTQERQVERPSEQNGYLRSAEPSEAEVALAQAIALEPARVEPYQELLKVYQADRVFTPTESRRWLEIWQAHGRDLAGSDRYARLCYDVGVLYLSYYDYMGLKDVADTDAQDGAVLPQVAVGQGALQNAARATEWFARARAACDPEAGSYGGLRVDTGLDEYAALGAYATIGEFYDSFATASIEGRDVAQASRSFYESLVAAILGREGERPLVLASEEMVQLRLYQVAFESMSSSAYLSGFQRAGVSEHELLRLLSTIHARITTTEFADYVAATRVATGAIFDEIVDGYEAAVANISRSYNSPAARVRPDAREGGS